MKILVRLLKYNTKRDVQFQFVQLYRAAFCVHIHMCLLENGILHNNIYF